MKYLIVSDSQGQNGNLLRVLKKVSPIDAMFHLGDSEMMQGQIEGMADCPVYAVAGNCDYFSSMEQEKVLTINGHRIAMTHGHIRGVKFGTEQLILWGQQMEAEIIMFGHTHMPMLTYEQNITLINPGSISQPRQSPSTPTYAIMEIDEKGEVHFTINKYRWYRF